MNALFAANFPTNTGYAWNTIEAVFARVAQRLSERGVSVHVSYPSLDGGDPVMLAGAPVTVLQADVLGARTSAEEAARVLRLVHERSIELLYLTDAATWSPFYARLRRAGVRTIVVHDRTSGERQHRSGITGPLKRALHRLPIAADRFIAVSDFVAERLCRVNGTPRERTFRVHNGIDMQRFTAPDRSALRRVIGVPDGVPVALFAGRARHYKGVGVLIDAVHRLQAGGRRIALAVCGDGDDLPDFRAQAQRLGVRDAHFLGKRGDVADLLSGATVVVVPSLWAEAFGLSVVEGMAAGVPVVATRTGGIPELIEHGRTGLLVRPGDAEALTEAVDGLLRDPTAAQRMARAGRERAFDYFNLERPAREIADVLLPPVVSQSERAAKPAMACSTPTQ